MKTTQQHKPNHDGRIEGQRLPQLPCIQTYYPPVEVELYVPSGKLVISGILFLKEYTNNNTDWPEIDDRSSPQARHKNQLEAFAKLGLIFGYMGNSTPDILQNGNSVALVDCSGGETGSIVGKLATDAGSYTIADYDDYLKKGGVTDQHWAHQRPVIVSVEPGRYVLTQHYGFGDQKGDGEQNLYATLERSDRKVENIVYPEEHALAAIGELFPDLSYLHVEVVSPFSLLKINFKKANSTLTCASATISADRVNDSEYLRNMLNSAWEERLIRAEDEKQLERTFIDRISVMASEDPEGFQKFISDIRVLDL